MRETRELVKKISCGVVGSLVDFLIWQTALVGASFGKSGSKGVFMAFREADKFLEKINHRTLAATWRELFRKKLLTYQKRADLYNPQITAYGRKRLAEKFPVYQKVRPWDGKVYLITYDIPEEAKIKRDRFRQFLTQINSKKMTESTYLNIYNPRKLIDSFIKERKIPGIIIVSDIGKDGGVGEMTLPDLLVKVYDLEEIHNRYECFISHAKKRSLSVLRLLFEYLSILKDDPQLPFEVLPRNWLGDKAYQEYLSLQEEYINAYAIA